MSKMLDMKNTCVIINNSYSAFIFWAHLLEMAAHWSGCVCPQFVFTTHYSVCSMSYHTWPSGHVTLMRYTLNLILLSVITQYIVSS